MAGRRDHRGRRRYEEARGRADSEDRCDAEGVDGRGDQGEAEETRASRSGAVLERAQAVVATGMTLSNGTFDTILERCRSRGVPLVVYAQTGSAVARAFLGSGVTALSAEPFPFSQFSAEETVLYRYRTAGGA
ncbi:DUF364 domain-containing protein [Streptomyces sp. NBC_01264]|nr:DUF364 domain-containing protein [Streptomyces sp. NBC_01264]MCX4779279.1 DUF364 domain-containing protein [Streptomyces sp. NBC_01264]